MPIMARSGNGVQSALEAIKRSLWQGKKGIRWRAANSRVIDQHIYRPKRRLNAIKQLWNGSGVGKISLPRLSPPPWHANRLHNFSGIPRLLRRARLLTEREPEIVNKDPGPWAAKALAAAAPMP